MGLILSYSAYVAEVYRAGIESVHPSQTAAARSLGLSRFQTLRYVVVPQAVRRVVPPLMNDFIALQKDTALVAIIGGNPPEAFLQGQIYQSGQFNFTALVGVALCFLIITVPQTRFADWMVARQRAKRQSGGSVTDALVIQDLHKQFGEVAVLKGIDLAVGEHEVICLIGASGSGKSTLLRCINLVEPIDSGHIMVLGRDITARGVDVE